jgi:PST family polysaccharide transporter
MQAEEKLTIADIKNHAIKSVKWTALAEIVSCSIQPVVTLILARLLTPADFGVVAVAMIAIGLAQIFQDFGLGKTLIQRETEIDKSANIIFWTNITLSVCIYLILFIIAPLFSKFFHEPKVIDILRVLCLLIILLSLISVQQALFQRQFQFKQLFFIRLFSSIVPGLVSIPLALWGYGVWALVFGTLAGAIAQVFLFWKTSPWRPQLSYDFQLAKRLYGFGVWVTAEAFLGWLMVWGDSVILGHFLGVKELGVYRVGVTFLALIFGFFLNPILPVVYSSFSRFQSMPSQLRDYFLKVTQLIATVAFPVGTGIVLLAYPLSSILFGEKWEGIEIVFMVLGIKDILSSIAGGINAETLRAIGRPDINVKLNILLAICFIPIYIFAAPHGLLIFCVARLLVGIITITLYIFAIMKFLKVPFIYPVICAWKQLFAVSIMGMVIYLFNYLISVHTWLSIVFVIVAGCVTYLAASWLIDKDTFRSNLRYAYMALKP